ncbi:MAG: SRPBCC domain-containing protein [Ignavibacteriae bacterium]|nr:SRPBCC domain-containing protein [Ignavibacteriota bacterium]
MELKTKIEAQDGKQELFIHREFEIPIELLFKAYIEPELIEQWMGTKVINFECKKFGGYVIETLDDKGKVAFQANGVFHEIIHNKKISRTFEMDTMPFGVQLEIYEFEKISNESSKLKIHTIFESVEKRDNLLKLPFAFGLNMAHNRIEKLFTNMKEANQ